MITSLSLTYAKALFDGSDLKRMERVLIELRELPKALTPHEAVFISPSFTFDEKSQLLDLCLSGKVESEVLNLLKLMTKMGRFEVFKSVGKAFELLLDQATGVIRGTVFSSHRLSEAEREKIEVSLRQLIRKTNVILKYEVDPELIGGVVAKVGGVIFDSSIRSYLANLSKASLEN
jgi:F-type H+-transporting ATPase subunit delta